MIKGGYDDYGIPYIMTDNRHSAKLYFYPAGKPIPTLQEDGTVVVSDIADPSDTSKIVSYLHKQYSLQSK